MAADKVAGDKVAAVIFEGGNPANSIEETMVRIRKAVTLDTIDRLRGVEEVGRIILSTNYGDLAARAGEIGAEPDFQGGPSPFHFGRRLSGVVRKYRLDRVLYMGGAAAPLISGSDLSWICGRLLSEENIVIMNNAQSADVIGFSPAGVLDTIELPPSDNFLGYLLREAGLRRVLLRNSPEVNFDLDTPTDFLILALLASGGSRAAAALREMNWDLGGLRRAVDTLRKTWVEIILIGRVGAPVMAYLNDTLKCRLRVFLRGARDEGAGEGGER